ncbi:MAG: hypothetical protein AAF363_14700 [Bacteroidota bacterium]
MKLLDKLPSELNKRKWIAIAITVILATPLTIWGIYGIGEYGLALFILTPLFIGVVSTILFGHGRILTKREAAQISLLTLGIFIIGLIVFAIEGLICIAMAAPVGILLTWIGSLIGQVTVNNNSNNSLTIILITFLIIPVTAFTERDSETQLHKVSTSLIIDADIETVWKNVIEFPRMGEPTEFIFKAGISYPIDSEIKETEEGLVRYCNFNTGSFVEPITEWNEPTTLRFDVHEQPEPMTEYSLWDINAPHLHDYFVSERGEFKLKELPNGQTELIGTTWYRHNIKPGGYWKLWSDWIIHSIHNRVLNHIKMNAETTS